MIPFVGLTGGMACGKSTVSAHFAALGVPIIDADDVGHTLYDVGGKAVRQIGREFGEEFIAGDGEVDRVLLRQAVFTDVRLRKRLEAITHPLIRKECLAQMNVATGLYGMLVAPLLFETNFLLERYRRSLVVDCDEDTQLAHGQNCGITSEQMKLVMKAQYPRKVRLKRADDVIVNSGQISVLAGLVQDMHEKYVALFA